MLISNGYPRLHRSLLSEEILSITFVENQKLELTILRHTTHTVHNSSIRSDEGLTLDMSALQLLDVVNLVEKTKLPYFTTMTACLREFTNSLVFSYTVGVHSAASW